MLSEENSSRWRYKSCSICYVNLDYVMEIDEDRD
jgi:hypothetical protein